MFGQSDYGRAIAVRRDHRKAPIASGVEAGLGQKIHSVEQGRDRHCPRKKSGEHRASFIVKLYVDFSEP